MGDSPLLILKRTAASSWILVTEKGITVTGPHRWGTAFQAKCNANAFASTWNARVLTEEEYGLAQKSGVSS